MKITRKHFLSAGGLSLVVVTTRKFLGAVQKVVPAGRARRWGMVIDVAKCLQEKDCTRCMEVCDKIHNIPVIADRRHEVKWIWKAPFEEAFDTEPGDYTRDALRGKQLPVLCNHCDDPPCARVCPTQATWRREDGIVMMDWHRCIGCRYCVAACPYGSRSFNWVDPRPYIRALNADYPARTKGVVEKCTFCEERLAKGQQPACVEVCPAHALTFGDLNDEGSPVRELLRSRYSTRRKPNLGTKPSIFYIV